jgi:hypothetical protein
MAEHVPIAVPLTAADESYTHQLVAPAAQTLYRSPGWADRCYHLLHAEGMTINAGRQLYVNDGRRYAFFGVASRDTQLCVRAAESFAFGDDPDQPTIGAVTVEVLKPLRQIRIAVDAPELDLAADLVYTARFDPVVTEPHLVSQNGEPVTHYMNFFQSGRYDGTVRVGELEHTIAGRFGFRDRGWGLRKHEGSPRRGFVAATFCELPDEAIYVILYETASGRRVFTNGWSIGAGGVRDTVTEARHALELDGTLVCGGRLDLTFASGAQRRVEIEVVARNYLAGVGYSRDERFRRAGTERFDLTDPATVAALDGQNDNGSTFRVDGVVGHGYIETGIGVHATYRPEP